MAKVDLISREWCELVFEGRNKSYGAYDLRAKSGVRNRRAFIFLISFLAVIALVIGVKSAVQAALDNGDDLDSSTSMMLQNLKEDKVEEEKPKDVPKDEPEPLEKVAVKASIQFTVPEIVDVVDETKKMKDQDELAETKISIASVTYEGDEGGKGTIDDLKDNQSAGGTEAAKELEDKKIYTVVETNPVFPGGDDALLAYVSSHIKYPAIAQEQDIQGVVRLRFVVLENGGVGDVQIVKSLDPSCDKEAIRVIKSLPRFTPAKQQGHAVKYWYNLPVRFTIM